MTKVALIKLGADGDVVRTLPVAEAISKRWNVSVTWITRSGARELLEGISFIKEILLPTDKLDDYDVLYNLDIDKEACQIENKVQARERYGFSSEEGYPIALNPGAQYYIDTIFDDELKKKNRKTYQEMMFDAANVPHNQSRYTIPLTENDRSYAERFAALHNLIGKKILGLHMGASSRWPSKVWHSDRIHEFIVMAYSKGFTILLFAGPNEAAEQKKILAELTRENVHVIANNPSSTKREFISLVSLCNWMVCSDSFALHVSIGLGKKTIGLFFCTSPDEIESYGLLHKVVSPFLYEFFPEKSDVYDDNLVKSISADEVISILKI